MNYRARWYELHGLPYEPPSLAPCLFFRCVGFTTEELYRRITSGQLGPRQRQPGEDEPEAA